MQRTLLIVACLAATPALAHDWYPTECCHSMDCAPVTKVEKLGSYVATMPGFGSGTNELALGQAMTSKHGTAIVPPTFPTRESKDHRMHICMRKDQYGVMKPICVFLPPVS